MRPRLARRAARISRIRGVPGETCARIGEEILGHLEDSAARYRSLGMNRVEAERLAIRDFGNPAKARQDIRRAFGGRETVLFPDEPGQSFRSFRIYDLKAVLVILAIVVVFRIWIVSAYTIPSKSMEPTIHGDPVHGDMVLVYKLFYWFSNPTRWQVAVFEGTKQNKDKNLIKRIVGLPGETIAIRNGDVYIDGKIARKPRSIQDEITVPVYEDGKSRLPGESKLTGLSAFRQTGEWKEDAGRFVGRAKAGKTATLAWDRPVLDTYPGGHARLRGHQVGDLVLAFTVEPREGVLNVGAVLREGDDHFELRLPVGKGDTALTRNKEEVGNAAGVHLDRGVRTRVRFANLDDRVTVEIDGKQVLSYDVPHASTAHWNGEPVAEFGVQGGTAAFGRVELRRDIYYTAAEFKSKKIPRGHYFVLGDNSENSSDSRDWGTISRDDLIGRPFMVFWPPDRMKFFR